MRHMIFGESHGPAIGVVLEGVPAGLELDLEAVQRELDRRKPGQDPTATARRESDTVQVLSGAFEGKTTGVPLAMLIPNADQHSQDDDGHPPHPPARPWRLCRLRQEPGVPGLPGRRALLRPPHRPPGGRRCGGPAAPGPTGRAGGRPYQLHLRHHRRLPARTPAIEAVAAEPFPVLDDAKGEEMRQAILEAKNEQDSVGGAIECAVFGLPAGLGAPDFGRNVEGIFAQHLFAVPAVKGVDFGAGVAFSLMRGSEANDPFEVKDGKGGPTNEATVTPAASTGASPTACPSPLRSPSGPTPSIALPQESVDLRTGGGDADSRSRAVTTPASSPAPCP